MAVEDETDPIRLRRAEIVAQVEGESDKANKLQAIQPDRPFHKVRDSMFSFSSEYTNYNGLISMGVALMVASNIHIVFESIIEFGILIDPVQWFKVLFSNPTESPSFLILLGLNFFVLSSLGIEKLLSKGFLSERLGLVFTATLLALEVMIPAIVIFHTDCYRVAALIVLMYVSIVFLKLVSYHMVNFWCRESLEKSKEDIRQEDGTSSLVHYPNNLNLKDMYYFLCAPTLCYELNFPRSPRIRKRFLIRCLLEMLVLLLPIICLIQQWLAPTINASAKAWQEGNYSRVLEKHLKLSVPAFLLWALLFYWIFHLYLNVFGEILRFGDRYFYGDWWNGKSLPEHWTKWNVPVHVWCVRHMYKPLLRSGFTKLQASCAVFIVSGLFHEYLYSVPVKAVRLWVPLAFIGQISNGSKSQNQKLNCNEKSSHSWYGNLSLWMSFVMGNPFCIFYIFVITMQ